MAKIQQDEKNRVINHRGAWHIAVGGEIFFIGCKSREDALRRLAIEVAKRA